MASDVDIVNLALVQLGASRINALTDNVKQAREANAIYALEREAELESHIWKCATKLAMLAPLATPPAFTGQFTTLYNLPTDFLRLELAGAFFPGASFTDYRNAPDATYQINSNQIATNPFGNVQPQPSGQTPTAGPLPIRYVAKITDPTQFSPSFIQALAMRLAARLAETLTQSTQKAQAALAAYGMAITMAVRINAAQRPPDPIGDSQWILGRI